MADPLPPPTRERYERNQIYRSSLSGDFYFARKVRLLGNGIAVVVGPKINITEQLQPFLLKRFRRKPRKEAQ